jgi:hypothetical protein
MSHSPRKIGPQIAKAHPEGVKRLAVAAVGFSAAIALRPSYLVRLRLRLRVG